MKVILLIKYSDKKIILRKIQLNSGLQDWLQKLKMSNFWQSLIKRSNKTSKIRLWGGSFKSKNLLNFNCNTEKFYNCHHTSNDAAAAYCRALPHWWLIQLHQKLFRIQQTEMQSIFGKAREEDTFMFSKKSAPPSQLWQRTVYYKLRLCCCLPSKVYNL